MPSERPLSGSLLALGAVTLLSAAGALGRHGGSFAIKQDKGEATVLVDWNPSNASSFDQGRAERLEYMIFGLLGSPDVERDWFYDWGSDHVSYFLSEATSDDVRRIAKALEEAGESGQIDTFDGSEVLFGARKTPRKRRLPGSGKKHAKSSPRHDLSSPGAAMAASSSRSKPSRRSAPSPKKKAQALASMKEMLERKYDHVAFLVKPTRFGDDLDRVHHYDLQDLIGDASDAGISEGWKVPAGSERVWHSFRDVSFSGIAKAAQVLERFRESGEVLDLESGDEILRFDAKKPFHLKRRAKKPAKKSKTSRSRKKKVPAEMKPRRGIKNGLVYIELPDYEPSSSEPKKRSYDYVRIRVRDHIPNLKTQNKIIEACGQCGVDGWDSFRDAEYSTYYVTKVTHTALERVADMLDQEGMTGEIYPDRSLPIRFGRGPAIDFD